MNPEIVNGLTALLWIVFIGYAVYRFLKFKAVIYNDDGTFIEIPLSSKVKEIDTGTDIYKIRSSAIVKKMILGILPQARIFFMKGCPEPIGFHSGQAVYNPTDLKLPVFGLYKCPKCKTEQMKIAFRVGSKELRDFGRETRTRNLGKPEGKKFDVKWLIYIGVFVIAAVFIYLAFTGMVGGGGTTTGLPPENVVI